MSIWHPKLKMTDDWFSNHKLRSLQTLKNILETNFWSPPFDNYRHICHFIHFILDQNKEHFLWHPRIFKAWIMVYRSTAQQYKGKCAFLYLLTRNHNYHTPNSLGSFEIMLLRSLKLLVTMLCSFYYKLQANIRVSTFGSLSSYSSHHYILEFFSCTDR